jgi:hypothetical protein
MSAYVVSKAHIDFLVQAALAGASDGVGWSTHTEPNLGWFHDDRWHRLVPSADVGDERPAAMPGFNSIDLVGPSVLGQRLLDECVASVHSRYPDTSPDEGDLPGPRDAYYMGPYVWEPYMQSETRLIARGMPRVILPPAPTVVIAKQIANYEYQSCEHDCWESSEAHAFCRALAERLLRSLPGWEEAPWGIDERAAA